MILDWFNVPSRLREIAKNIDLLITNSTMSNDLRDLARDIEDEIKKVNDLQTVSLKVR